MLAISKKSTTGGGNLSSMHMIMGLNSDISARTQDPNHSENGASANVKELLHLFEKMLMFKLSRNRRIYWIWGMGIANKQAHVHQKIEIICWISPINMLRQSPSKTSIFKFKSLSQSTAANVQSKSKLLYVYSSSFFLCVYLLWFRVKGNNWDKRERLLSSGLRRALGENLHLDVIHIWEATGGRQRCQSLVGASIVPPYKAPDDDGSRV